MTCIWKTNTYLVSVIIADNQHRFSANGVRWEMHCGTIIFGGGKGGARVTLEAYLTLCVDAETSGKPSGSSQMNREIIVETSQWVRKRV